MADRSAGIEASAVSLLKQAVELDTQKRFTEALVCYREGIQLLLDVIKSLSDEAKKQRFRDKVEEYMSRAETLKQLIEKELEEGKQNEQIHIPNNSTGHSYEALFGRFFDGTVTSIQIEDPYIRSVHQIYNLLRFCELAVKKSGGKLKSISLLTGTDSHPDAQRLQNDKLFDLKKSLQSYGVALNWEISETLHDREIRMDNGWIIKIGRGLDIYKATANKFSIGYCDYDLRQCHETTIDIFHKKTTKRKMENR